MIKKSTTPLLLIILLVFVVFFWFSYFKLLTPQYLTFSDGAKYADIARNIVKGNGYVQSFAFFVSNLDLKSPGFASAWSSPAMPYTLAAFFKATGVSDYSVFLTSFVLYLSLIITVFLLGKKLYGNLTGFLAAIFIAGNLNVLDYATSAASEILFLLLVVLVPLFFISKRKWLDLLGFFLLVVMYFTRPQSVVFIVGYIWFWFLLHFSVKKAMLIFIGVLILGFLFDHFILARFNGQYHIYTILGRSTHEAVQYTPEVSTSDILRGAAPVASQGSFVMFKKIFYNLYNFYRLAPEILSPYLLALFLIGLVHFENKRQTAFKVVSLSIVIFSLLGAAATIPFFRYIHPVLPLIYLIAAAGLTWIARETYNTQFIIKLKKNYYTAAVAILLGFLLSVGQTVGVIFLDSRYSAKSLNRGKPPVYVSLSKLLKENTSDNSAVITNLDTWGSWYGERKTVWFPLKPDQLTSQKPESGNYDAIFLTNYLMDDNNYYMGEEWRQILNDPQHPQNEFIAKNYKLIGKYQIPAKDTYENKDGYAVLLKRI